MHPSRRLIKKIEAVWHICISGRQVRYILLLEPVEIRTLFLDQSLEDLRVVTESPVKLLG